MAEASSNRINHTKDTNDINPTKAIEELISFLEASPTPFHAVQTVEGILQDAGFISTSDQAPLLPGQGYYRATEGTLIAFRLPSLPEQEWESLTRLPLRLWGAHTDSPALKIKPRPVTIKNQHIQIGVEVYGGAILNTWLDRPLGVAGKVFTSSPDDSNGHRSNLIKSKPGLIIPNAAIHLNRNINSGFSLSPDTHLPALWSGGTAGIDDWFSCLISDAGISGEILSHDLFLYDPQPPVLLGREGELLNAPRLDNLAMVHAGLSGYLSAPPSEQKPFIASLAIFNHEEIGSMTYEGAASNLLLSEIEFLYERLHTLSPRLSWGGSRENSFMISADMAHGFHPNYESWYESQHRPVLNGGPVIKYNVSHRYAGSAATTARIKQLFGRPLQEYLHHPDIPCGSTIGPLVSGRLAIPAIDIGNPLWAMHSIRETAGAKDHSAMIELAEKFFRGEG